MLLTATNPQHTAQTQQDTEETQLSLEWRTTGQDWMSQEAFFSLLAALAQQGEWGQVPVNHRERPAL